jgi:IS5 family transposase
MHQTKKGNQWYFGMKAHFGVDSCTKLIHAVGATPANVADGTVLPGDETRVWGDQAYRGQRPVIRRRAPRAQDFVNRRYRHRGVVDEVERAKNRTKSKVRAKVEHPIGVIKRVFGFVKVRYPGLAKNAHRLVVTCALANLFMGRPASIALAARVMCPELIQQGSMNTREDPRWHSGPNRPLPKNLRG